MATILFSCALWIAFLNYLQADEKTVSCIISETTQLLQCQFLQKTHGAVYVGIARTDESRDCIVDNVTFRYFVKNSDLTTNFSLPNPIRNLVCAVIKVCLSSCLTHVFPVDKITRLQAPSVQIFERSISHITLTFTTKSYINHIPTISVTVELLDPYNGTLLTKTQIIASESLDGTISLDSLTPGTCYNMELSYQPLTIDKQLNRIKSDIAKVIACTRPTEPLVAPQILHLLGPSGQTIMYWTTLQPAQYGSRDLHYIVYDQTDIMMANLSSNSYCIKLANETYKYYISAQNSVGNKTSKKLGSVQSCGIEMKFSTSEVASGSQSTHTVSWKSEATANPIAIMFYVEKSYANALEFCKGSFKFAGQAKFSDKNFAVTIENERHNIWLYASTVTNQGLVCPLTKLIESHSGSSKPWMTYYYFFLIMTVALNLFCFLPYAIKVASRTHARYKRRLRSSTENLPISLPSGGSEENLSLMDIPSQRIPGDGESYSGTVLAKSNACSSRNLNLTQIEDKPTFVTEVPPSAPTNIIAISSPSRQNDRLVAGGKGCSRGLQCIHSERTPGDGKLGCLANATRPSNHLHLTQGPTDQINDKPEFGKEMPVSVPQEELGNFAGLSTQPLLSQEPSVNEIPLLIPKRIINRPLSPIPPMSSQDDEPNVTTNTCCNDFHNTSSKRTAGDDESHSDLPPHGLDNIPHTSNQLHLTRDPTAEIKDIPDADESPLSEQIHNIDKQSMSNHDGPGAYGNTGSCSSEKD